MYRKVLGMINIKMKQTTNICNEILSTFSSLVLLSKDVIHIIFY